jgi:hypothetical protein
MEAPTLSPPIWAGHEILSTDTLEVDYRCSLCPSIQELPVDDIFTHGSPAEISCSLTGYVGHRWSHDGRLVREL